MIPGSGGEMPYPPPADPKTAATFRTSEVASLCEVSRDTVARWIDHGRLMGYTVAGSKHRRVDRDSLIQFLNQYEMWGALERMGCERTLTVI